MAFPNFSQKIFKTSPRVFNRFCEENVDLAHLLIGLHMRTAREFPQEFVKSPSFVCF
jgi:hypothetical protein